MIKLLFLIISIIISGCGTTPEVKLHESSQPSVETSRWARINKDQPISVGEVIYATQKGFWVRTTVSYRYMGVDDRNNIKVIYKFEHTLDVETKPPQVETFALLLPLNAKKQTILKVESFEGAPWKKELLITVVDEFNRITAEEIGKTQTK